MPDTYVEELIDGGADPAAIGLDTVAWAEASRYATDGALTWPRVKRLHGFTAGRLAQLVIAGAWRTSEAGVQLARYLVCNRTSAEMQALREKRASVGGEGGRRTAAKTERDERGHFTKGADDQREPSVSPAFDEREPNATPASDPVHAQDSKQDAKHLLGHTGTGTGTSTGTGTEQPKSVPSWADQWQPFLAKWCGERGYREPTGPQRDKILWPILDAAPSFLLRTVDEIPDGHPDPIGYVKDADRRRRQSSPADEPVRRGLRTNMDPKLVEEMRAAGMLS